MSSSSEGSVHIGFLGLDDEGGGGGGNAYGDNHSTDLVSRS